MISSVDYRKPGPAIIAPGKNSLKIAHLLLQHFPCSRIFNTTKALELIFKSYRQVIFIGALGIAARKTAPIIKDKHRDPAVVVIDTLGHYAISFLSGHLGGANILCHKIAKILGSAPVVTTASDLKGLLTPDFLASLWNLIPEYNSDEDKSKILLEINSRIIDNKKIHWRVDSPFKEELKTALEANNFQGSMPKKIDFLVNETTSNSKYEEYEHGDRYQHDDINYIPQIIISDKDKPSGNFSLALRPKSIIAGIGCRKGTNLEDIILALEKALERANVSKLSLKGLASVKQKRCEFGLIQTAGILNLPLYFYDPLELSNWQEENKKYEKESKFVKKTIGVGEVCEPAAKIAAKNQNILLEKTVSSCKKVTVALARATWPWWALDPEENIL